ncbi:MAG: hypothetical protein WCP58_08140 [bacterium]
MSALEGAILRTLREAGIEKPPVEAERVLRFLDWMTSAGAATSR